MSDSEKRSFFRINSELAFNYNGVDLYTVENEKADSLFISDTQTVTFYSELQRLNSESSSLLSNVGEMNRPLADYLNILNKKVDLLSRHFIAERNVSDDIEPTLVNLSEGGIAFVARKALYKGSYLALKLVFMDTFSIMTCFGRVIRSDEKSKGEHQVAIKFLRMSDANLQMLSKQLFRAQLRLKKNKELESKTNQILKDDTTEKK